MKPELKRILVPVDFSEPSREALRQGLSLAQRLGAEVEVLHVWESPPYVSPANLATLQQAPTQLWEHVQRDLEHQLRALVAELRAPGDPPVHARVLNGYVSEAILHEIEIGDYELVVVGSHGRRGLARWLLGSVAERVARAATCPVLIAHERVRRAREQVA